MRKKTFAAAVLLAAATLTLSACGGSDDTKAQLSVSSAYMPQPVSDMAAEIGRAHV